jgi:hypothetical protein
MTKLSIVKNAVTTSKFVASINAGAINLALDTKEVSSAYGQVFAKNYKSEYAAKRNARKPLCFDINKF